jgi:hypothetical protein
VTINTAGAARALDVLNRKQSMLLEKAGTYIEEGVQITRSAMETAAEVRKATGESFVYLLKKTSEAWGIFGDQAKLMLEGLMGTAPGSGRPSKTQAANASSRSSSSANHGANGLLGDTLGPTQLTVGEVKGEKVAILKNPRLMPSSSLGGATPGTGGMTNVFQITIVGGSTDERSDVESLARRISRMVEESMAKRASTLGLRTPS